jgi:hypothetical protein
MAQPPFPAPSAFTVADLEHALGDATDAVMAERPHDAVAFAAAFLARAGRDESASGIDSSGLSAADIHSSEEAYFEHVRPYLQAAFSSAVTAVYNEQPHDWQPFLARHLAAAKLPDTSAPVESGHLDPSAHKAIPLLRGLDDRLERMLSRGIIKLLRADVLRSDVVAGSSFEKILRRQDLESLEASSGVRLFLSAEEAVAALRSSSRSVGALTYGWTSPDHPDVTNKYLAAVRRFLRSPLGSHIVGLFWEYARAVDGAARCASLDELPTRALARAAALRRFGRSHALRMRRTSFARPSAGWATCTPRLSARR